MLKLFPFILIHISICASERPHRGPTLAITWSGHAALLLCSLHECRLDVTRHVSECLFLLQPNAPHISFTFIQSNFPFWFWQHADQIGGCLMTGNTWVGILSLLFFGRSRQLVSTPASGLAGHPVDDDKRQTHDHEDKAQGSKARSLWKWKEQRSHRLHAPK